MWTKEDEDEARTLTVDGVKFMLEDVESIHWKNRNKVSYLKAKAFYIELKNGDYLEAVVEDIDYQTKLFIYDFVEPM